MANIEQITKALSSTDEEIRLQGLREAGDCEAEEVLPLVFNAFGDASWRVRKQAVDLFMNMPVSRELIGEIIELLHAEENAGLRNAAVEILTRMGKLSVPMLLEQARCPDHDVRKFIIDILGDIAAPEAVPRLIDGLEDSDSNVRAAAAENLGKLKAVDAVDALLKAMEHPDLLLQFTILDALSRIAAPVPIAKLSPYKDEKLLRKALIDCLGKAGDSSAAEELVSALTDPMRNVREAAILGVVEIFNRHPDEVRSQLKMCDQASAAITVSGYLDDEYNDALKRSSIQILGWLAAEDAVEPLLRILGYETLQQAALEALIEIGKGNPSALINTWSSVDGERRAYLAYILGEAECTEALPLLKGGLSEDDAQVVRMSVLALGRIGAADLLPDLVRCLEQDDAEIQNSATQSLITLGVKFPKETFSALQPLLNHSEALQRMHAVVILRELNNPGVLDALGMAIKDSAAEVRRAAIKVFERFDISDHISSLLLALTDEDAEVRRTVVEILGNCDDETASDGLQLALQDEDIWVRSSAVRGLGRLDGERSRHLIEKALQDPVGLVSIAALETLAALSGEGAVEQMVGALGHADEEVVTAAMNLLTQYGAGEWIGEHADDLINHPFWVVRAQVARSAVEVNGASARSLLESRLAIENEEVVRQQLVDLLADLPGE